MHTVQWVPTLMFVTFAAAVGFGMIQLFAFLQRRSNRDAAANALTGTDSRADHGALPELAGAGAIALVAIALLTFGYNGRGEDKASAGPSSATASASATDQMTTPARPRANPADMATPPTQYPFGDGSPNAAPTNPVAMAPARPATTGVK